MTSTEGTPASWREAWSLAVSAPSCRAGSFSWSRSLTQLASPSMVHTIVLPEPRPPSMSNWMAPIVRAFSASDREAV